MRTFKNFVYWIFVCCLPILIITSNIRWGVTSIKVYEYGFAKYQISQITGIDNEQLSMVASHLIDYFNAEVDTAQLTVIKAGEEFRIFNERELIHLQDVQNLIQLDYMVQWIVSAVMIVCALVFIVWSNNRIRDICKSILWGTIATLGLMFFLILWSIFGFEKLFLLFHYLSFSNELWILDPAKDYLIMLFPGPFFYDVAIWGFIVVFIETLFVGGVAFTMLKLTGKKKLIADIEAKV